MNLKILRKQEKKSQDDLAKVINVARSTYNGYELGTSEPTIETLIKLADYYGVTLDYLVGRQFNNEFGYLTVQEREFVKNFLLLNEKNKYKILGYALALLSEQE